MLRKLLSFVVVTVVLATAGTSAVATGHPRHGIALSPLGTYHTSAFDAAAAEIVAHDPAGDLAPEGLLFIAGKDSPTGGAAAGGGQRGLPAPLPCSRSTALGSSSP